MHSNEHFQKPVPEGDAKRIHPLLLAYIGDAVYELRVREHLLQQGAVKMTGLHAKAVAYVNAERQSKLYAQIESILDETEQEVLRHGRNAKSGHQPPHVTVGDYRRATGVEALIGYLYLTEKQDRLDAVFQLLFEEV